MTVLIKELSSSSGCHYRLRADFKRLHEEVSEKVIAAAELSKDIKGVVFSNILAMLGDRGALQDLVHMVRGPTATEGRSDL